VKCRETASVGQPNYSSLAIHSKPSGGNQIKNQEQEGMNQQERERSKRNRGTSKHRQNKKRRTNSQNNKNEEGRRRKALSRPGHKEILLVGAN